MKNFIVLILLVCLSQTIFAQQKNNLTGILSIDSKEVAKTFNSETTIQFNQEAVDKKSPFLAGVLSFAIPGSGEIYNGDYLKAAVFLAAEVSLIYLNSHYNKKGDDKTTEFQNYANGGWSVKRYAKWAMERFGLTDEWYSKVIDGSGPEGVNWSELHNMENVISRTQLGKYFSHNLSDYQDQQYYEMIGKYTQFLSGWDDFSDPNLVYEYGDGTTPNFDLYSNMRGDANSFYNTASTMTTILILNHVISGVDAILSANAYNKKIEVKAKLANRNFGLSNVYYPELNFRLSI